MKYPRLLSVALLAGTIIGAGMFSLPFVVRTLGLGTSVAYIAMFLCVYVATHRMYAALLETRADGAQFGSLAEAYLPHRMAPLAGKLILLELILVLTIYLMLAPAFIELAAPGMGMLGLATFWALGSIALFLKTSWLGWGEALGIIAILAIVVAVLSVRGITALAVPLFQPLSLGTALLPFGPLLFSFAGRPAIGKVVEVARAVRANGSTFPMGGVIALGTALPVVVYLVFVVGVLRIAPNAGPDTVSSITHAIPWLPITLGALGLVTLWTSYVVIGVNMKEILERDFRWKRVVAAAIVVLAPLALYAAGVREFFAAIGFAGGVFLALEGVLIVMMWRRAFPHHPWRSASWLLVPIFLTAVAYEVAHVVGAV